MEKVTAHCPNCSAPIELPLGEVEVLCEFCESRLKFLPDTREMAVVKTREEMKYRERVEVQKAVLNKQLQQEELAAWRRTAADVAIRTLPVIGPALGRGLFRAALGSRGGCLGCGCLTVLLGVAGLLLAIAVGG